MQRRLPINRTFLRLSELPHSGLHQLHWESIGKTYQVGGRSTKERRTGMRTRKKISKYKATTKMWRWTNPVIISDEWRQQGITYHQEETKRIVEVNRISVWILDVKPSRSKDNREGDPETTIWTERGGTEGVSGGHFPWVASQLFSVISVLYTYHMPASNWTKPPYPNAGPMTMLGSVTSLVCQLIRDSKNVVKPNAANPWPGQFAPIS